MIAVISLIISAVALALAAVLPVWEKYAPPKVVVRPPDHDRGRNGWTIRVTNLRRDPLEVRETWVELSGDRRVSGFYMSHGVWQEYFSVPARGSADFTLNLKDEDHFVLFNVLDNIVVMTGFCEEGVGHAWRSRPLDVSTDTPVLFRGWRRFASGCGWEWRRVKRMLHIGGV